MRRLPVLLSVAIAAPTVAVALPVVTAPAASAHPVAPVVSHVSMQVTPGPVLAPTSGPQAAATLGAAPERVLAAVPAESTHGFSLVGLSWRHDPRLAALTAQIRVRSGGVWSAWQRQDLGDLAPDDGSVDARHAARDVTEPSWVGHADAVQAELLAVTGPLPQDLRIDLIDPGSSGADTTLGRAPHALSQAAADPSQPPIITRAQWGADESLRQRACPSGPYYTGTPRVAFVHHTVTGNSYGPGDTAAVVRSIYAYHVLSNGWCDVGYNFLVDQYGQIFEGRYGGVDKAVLGAHTGGFNTDSFGVAMIGTFQSVSPSPALLTSLAQLLAWKLAISYANPLGQASLTAASFNESRYAPGTNVALNVISGHRDVDSTDCPGNVGYAALPALRQAVFNDMGGVGLIRPNVFVTNGANGSSQTVNVTAGMIAAGSWQLTIRDASGATLRTFSGQGGSGDNSVSVAWDLTTDAGDAVKPGTFSVTLTSTQNGAAVLPWSGTVSTVALGPFARLAGADRYATSVAVGQSAAPSSSSVVLASGITMPDAVTAGPLAAHLNAPLLLTAPDGLPASVQADIATRHPATAYVIGGPAAIGASVETQLHADGVTTVTRLGGADRFATAALVAEQMGASGGQAVVVDATHLIDGVTIGGIAGSLGEPILMASSNGVPEATATALQTLNVVDTAVIGQSLPASVVDALPGGHTIGGRDRYATSVAVADVYATQVSPGSVVLADGAPAYPVDALAAAALGRPTLLVQPTLLPTSVASWLSAATTVQSVVAVGGPTVISDLVAGSASGDLSES